MASKRPSSPAQLPSWLPELLQAMQQLQQDFARQDSSLREIRSITLENQHLLRSRVQDSLSKLTQPPTPRARIPRTAASQQAAYSEAQLTTAILNAQNQLAVRNAAFAIPRPVQPNPRAMPKVSGML